MDNITSLNCITNVKESYEQMRNEQIALCDILEDIADSLPYNIDERACVNTARMIKPLILRSHKMAVEILFPLLENSNNYRANLDAILHRLKNEYIKNEYSAEEISEILLSYGKGKPIQSAEATGYMLRGFFEALRRHVAFERELFGSIFQQ